MGPGWIGELKVVEDFLAAAEADRDEEGRFLLSGQPVTVGLGGQEVVVPEGTNYHHKGEAHSLFDALQAGQLGVAVMVL